MYIGSTGSDGLHFLLFELLCETIEDHWARRCDVIAVDLLPTGGCRIADNGPDPVPETTQSPLHDGQHQFVRSRPTSLSYHSGKGLHGLNHPGAENALSARCHIEFNREGKRWISSYEQGRFISEVEASGHPPERGMTVTFWPDPVIFRPDAIFQFDLIAERFRQFAFLNPQLTLNLTDERSSPTRKESFRSPGGIYDFVRSLNATRRPTLGQICYLEGKEGDLEFAAAMQWTEARESSVLTFVNSYQTPLGGTHLGAFRHCLGDLLSKYGLFYGVFDKERIHEEDCFEGLTALVTVKVPYPQYSSGSRSSLGNPEVAPLIQSTMQRWFAAFLETYETDAIAICKRVLTAYRQRTESAVRRRRRRPHA